MSVAHDLVDLLGRKQRTGEWNVGSKTNEPWDTIQKFIANSDVTISIEGNVLKLTRKEDNKVTCVMKVRG